MRGNLIVSFDATPHQVEMLLDFCREKTGSEYVITVCQTIRDGYALGLSIFENRPDVFMGVIDLTEERVVPNATLTDEEIKAALVNLDYKYAHATSRKPPIANKMYVMAWIDYINMGPPIVRIPIEPEDQEEPENENN